MYLVRVVFNVISPYTLAEMNMNFKVHLLANVRTCWIYNLCGFIWIYKNQISAIDPKYGSIKIFVDQCGSIPINSNQLGSVAVHLGVKMADTLSFTAKVDMVDF